MLTCKLGHYKLMEIARESKDNYDKLTAHALEQLGKELPTYEDIMENKGYHSLEFLMNDVSELPSWILNRIEFDRPQIMKLLKDDAHINPKNLMQAIKMNQVHLPDHTIINFDEVTWMEDACTQDLQKSLDENWRIIAVCLQPGQRRPDYVLGRKRGVQYEN